MNTLEEIRLFVVPISIVQQTNIHLQRAGQKQCECFVLWSGVREEDVFQVRTLHLPRQTAYRFEDGLCVRVDGTELHRLNVWLFDHEEELAIQIHSHPTEAYHSETDDAFPIVTTRGALSLVVPDFARVGLHGYGVAGYRLTHNGWDRLSTKQIGEVLQFKE